MTGPSRLCSARVPFMTPESVSCPVCTSLVLLTRITDPVQLPEGAAAKIPMMPPAKLAGLGYIPADVDFLAGIHVAELMDQPDTAQILSDLRAQGAFDLVQLARSTSLKLEDIDHIILSAD